MDITFADTQDSHRFAFEAALSAESLQSKAPAAFAASAHERTSKSYAFISTERVLDAFRSAGFVAVEARQTRTRILSPLHARHLIRLRRRVEAVALDEGIPELWFLNSHDGTSAYQLRVGIYRPVCTNGLMVSVGTLPTWRIPHRGNVLDDVIRGALELSEQFSLLVPSVERMQSTILTELQRLDFAQQALVLRFPKDDPDQTSPAELLIPRRQADVGSDLWRTLNVVQEGILRGGLRRRTKTNRMVITRRIGAIREDVRLNTALWGMALARAA